MKSINQMSIGWSVIKMSKFKYSEVPNSKARNCLYRQGFIFSRDCERAQEYKFIAPRILILL